MIERQRLREGELAGRNIGDMQGEDGAGDATNRDRAGNRQAIGRNGDSNRVTAGGQFSLARIGDRRDHTIVGARIENQLAIDRLVIGNAIGEQRFGQCERRRRGNGSRLTVIGRLRICRTTVAESRVAEQRCERDRGAVVLLDRILEVGAGAAWTGAAAIGTIRTGRDVDTAVSERCEQNLLLHFDFADQHGRDLGRTADDDDFRSVGLDEDEVGAFDLDIVDRNIGREMGDIAGVRGYFGTDRSGRSGRGAIVSRNATGGRRAGVASLCNPDLFRNWGSIRRQCNLFLNVGQEILAHVFFGNARQARIFNGHDSIPKTRTVPQ